MHRLADGGAYQLILTRGRIRSILTATGSEGDSSPGRRLAGSLAAACDLGDAEAVQLRLAEIAQLDDPDGTRDETTLEAEMREDAAALEAALEAGPDATPEVAALMQAEKERLVAANEKQAERVNSLADQVAAAKALPGVVSALSNNTKTLAHAAIGQAHASRVMLGGAPGGGWLGPTASAALFHIMQHPELTHEECDQGRAVAWGAAPEEAAALRRMYPAKAARYGAVVHALATAASVEQRNVALGMGLRHIVDIAVLRALLEAGAQVNEPGVRGRVELGGGLGAGLGPASHRP